MRLQISNDHIADAAVMLTDVENDLFILLACEAAPVIAAQITEAVNNIDDWKQAAGVEAGLRRKAQDRIDDLEEALHRIVQWSEAYPLDVFPEPDLAKARELLEAGGITLDSISAYCIRHVVKGVGEIARKALGAEPAVSHET
jgi:hypothetical protein